MDDPYVSVQAVCIDGFCDIVCAVQIVRRSLLIFNFRLRNYRVGDLFCIRRMSLRLAAKRNNLIVYAKSAENFDS